MFNLRVSDGINCVKCVAQSHYRVTGLRIRTSTLKSELLTSETLRADLLGTVDTKLADNDALDLVTDLASRANLLRPVTTLVTCVTQWPISISPIPPTSFASSSIGCLRAVMSLNVHRNNTTTSRSFLIGDMCIRSHSGVPAIQENILTILNSKKG